MLRIIIDSRETNLYNNIIERDLDKYTDKNCKAGDISYGTSVNEDDILGDE